jgi:hypothetical protein
MAGFNGQYFASVVGDDHLFFQRGGGDWINFIGGYFFHG